MADLLSVLVYDPDADEEQVFQAQCHFCGGYTPELKLRGKTMIEGLGKTNWNGYTDDQKYLKTGPK
jgi:hypothetical protein